MVGLLDIAPARKSVALSTGQALEVSGVSASGVASLLARFPELRAVFAGQEAKFTPEKMMEAMPGVVAAIIAAGSGYPGDEKAEAIALSLPLADQAALLDTVMRLTMPEGLGPFVQAVKGLVAVLGLGKVAEPKTSPAPSKSS